MDLRKLKTLIDLVSESNISELEITEAEGKVRIVKGAWPHRSTSDAVGPAASQPSRAAPAAAPVPAGRAAATGHAIKSPMVGCLPLLEPGAPAFVEIGSQVKKATVCIIQTMRS
jgi:acetyl-CoA carboxylase biotin carboxyl carrier protein